MCLNLDKELIRVQSENINMLEEIVKSKDEIIDIKNQQIEFLENHIKELNKLVDKSLEYLSKPILVQ